MIWTILIATALINLVSLALAGANQRVHQATIAAIKREDGLRGGVTLGAVALLSGLSLATCWTVYAFQVEDWRFAAIAWIPIVTGAISRAVRTGD